MVKDNNIIIKLFDSWTLIHVLSGLIAGFIFFILGFGWWSVLGVLLLEIVWEIMENSSFGSKIWKPWYPKYKGDTYLQLGSDIVMTVIGGVIGSIIASEASEEAAAIYIIGISIILLILFFNNIRRKC